jgi:hypothetical protein
VKFINKILFISVLLLLSSCIAQFIPQTNENPELLVVEGLITDLPGPDTVKLSSSVPLGTKASAKPVSGSVVSINDEFGTGTSLSEIKPGIYVTPNYFHGTIGHHYTLNIRIKPSSNDPDNSYTSYPMEMKPVPPIDSIYYEKVKISEASLWSQEKDGCQIYLNTHDPANECKFYRWEFVETWEFRIPYTVPNSTCWATGHSDQISIKSTASFAESKIIRFPLNFVSNGSDRLKVKYSVLVNQYSLNEDEFLYWEKLQNLSQQVGGLYDIIPSSVPSNVFCVNNPNKKVLGYFSVSAAASKRVFIKDRFLGQANPYSADNCVADTIFGGKPIPLLNQSVWVIVDNFEPPYKVITYTRGCADCTTRGTRLKPDFWQDK